MPGHWEGDLIKGAGNQSSVGVHDQDALDSIADLMNNRPRQTLDWRSPYQAFTQCMAALEDRNSSAIH